MNAAGGSDTSAAQDDSPPAASLTPGELLRRERERRSIPQLQAAEDLHLDLRTLQAMEANRFDLLGVPVYARGHLRKYAELLGLSPQFILERYEALNDRPAVPTPVPISATAAASVPLERASSKGPLWMSIGVIVIAFGWWIFDGLQSRDAKQSAEQVPAMEAPADAQAPSEPTARDESPAAAPTPASVSAAPSTTTAEAGASASVTSPPAAAVVQNPSPIAMRPANTPAAIPAADVRVRLEYSGACWTEIYDAAGKRLAFGMGDIGRVRMITGTPPLRVTLGNVSAVTVQINDSAVVVPRQSGKDSAKFLIAADGAVQTMSGEVPVE